MHFSYRCCVFVVNSLKNSCNGVCNFIVNFHVTLYNFESLLRKSYISSQQSFPDVLQNKCSWKLLKKYPDCGQLWVKYLIYNAIFKSFQEKKLKIVPCRVFLSRFVHDYLSKCSNPKKIPSPKKFLATCLKHLCWSKFLITFLDWMLPYRIFFGFFPFFSDLLLLLSGYEKRLLQTIYDTND